MRLGIRRIWGGAYEAYAEAHTERMGLLGLEELGAW
jgi:hypothetical protein